MSWDQEDKDKIRDIGTFLVMETDEIESVVLIVTNKNSVQKSLMINSQYSLEGAYAMVGMIETCKLMMLDNIMGAIESARDSED